MEHSNTYLLIVEGLATGLSLHECTSHTVFVAFDAGNLLSVAELARRLYPDCTIVLCADNDIKEDNASNIGIEKATEAALAINGYLAIPRFNGMKIDWNDLHVKMGIGEVQNQFMCYSRPDGLPSSNTSDKLPPGFSLRMKGCLPGLWHIEVKDDGHPVGTWIGPPLYIEGITRDELGNHGVFSLDGKIWIKEHIHGPCQKHCLKTRIVLFGVVVLLMKDGVVLLEVEYESF